MEPREVLLERCIQILRELSAHALDKAESMLVEIRSWDFPGGIQPLPTLATPPSSASK